MINLTENVLFLQQGPMLRESVANAIESACKILRETFGCADVPSNRFTAKTYPQLFFVKIAEDMILRNRDVLDESYVADMFEFWTARRGWDADLFERVLMGHKARKSVRENLARPFGIALLKLHAMGCIVLPREFRLPGVFKLESVSVDFTGQQLPEIFTAIRRPGPDRRAWPLPLQHLRAKDVGRISSCGTQVLLQLGWLKPEDGNISDLIKLHESTRSPYHSYHYPIRRLVDVLQESFGDRFPITVAAYEIALADARQRRKPIEEIDRRVAYQATKEQLSADLAASTDMEVDERILAYAANVRTKDVLPHAVRSTAASISNYGVAGAIDTWLLVEEKTRRLVVGLSPSTKKMRNRALDYLNLYLFCYLPLWFENHASTQLRFPISPRDFLAGVYGSRIEDGDDYVLPATLESFIRRCCDVRSHIDTGAVNLLSDIRRVFEDIERHAREWPGCVGFTQPFPSKFSGISRPNGTKKTLIPRELLAPLLQVVEAWKLWVDTCNEKIFAALDNSSKPTYVRDARSLDYVSQIDAESIAKELRTIDLESHLGNSGRTLADIVGLCPVVFLDTGPLAQADATPSETSHGRYATYYLRFMPNVCNFGDRRLTRRDGTLAWLARPHSLNQLITFIHTGLRANHVQWLDESSFDCVSSDNSDGVRTLWVNTDKAKAKGWPAWVSERVMDVLEEQRAWRRRADLVGCDVRKYYNDSESAIYQPFLPLFSYGENGLPNTDNNYIQVWGEMLAFTQSMLIDLDLQFPILSKLLPAGFEVADQHVGDKLERKFGNVELFEEGDKVDLIWKSEITVHSARTTLVSEMVTMLPPEVIGTHLTGQKTRTVYFYAQVDESRKADYAAAQKRTFGKAYGARLDAVLNDDYSGFARTDDVHSPLVRGLKADIEMTFISHGCIVSRWPDTEEDAFEILRKKGTRQIAANKTEICVYGNWCPPQVVAKIGRRRCPLCPFALRAVDHLPAVSARRKSAAEDYGRVMALLNAHANKRARRLTNAERQEMYLLRNRLAEDASQWRVIETLLQEQYERIRNGGSGGRWIAQQPDLLTRSLIRIEAPDNLAQYVLARLPEVLAYGGETDALNAQMEVLRRRLLAGTSGVLEALSVPPATNPAFELLGVVRTTLEVNGMSGEQFLDAIKSDNFIGLPTKTEALLP